MRRFLFTTAAGLLVPLLGLANAWGDESRGQLPKKPDGGTCGSFGTAVEFVDTPSEAARQAKKEQKLVFVLHVSGHFEDPKLT